jgi:alpha-ribazole phosphatase
VAAAPGLCYGRLDLGLGPGAGAEIARACALAPRARRIVTSPAARARALAEALAERDGLKPEPDPRLRELDFGAWEGRPWAEIDRAESDPWAEDPEHRAPPGGERFADLRARVTAALAGLSPGTLVVTHAGPVRAARMLAEGLSFAAVFAEPVPHAKPIAIPALGEAATWPG